MERATLEGWANFNQLVFFATFDDEWFVQVEQRPTLSKMTEMRASYDAMKQGTMPGIHRSWLEARGAEFEIVLVT
jgi:hypothetical protein